MPFKLLSEATRLLLRPYHADVISEALSSEVSIQGIQIDCTCMSNHPFAARGCTYCKHLSLIIVIEGRAKL
jgi:hypothetical protein